MYPVSREHGFVSKQVLKDILRSVSEFLPQRSKSQVCIYKKQRRTFPPLGRVNHLSPAAGQGPEHSPVQASGAGALGLSTLCSHAGGGCSSDQAPSRPLEISELCRLLTFCPEIRTGAPSFCLEAGDHCQSASVKQRGKLSRPTTRARASTVVHSQGCWPPAFLLCCV